MRYVNRWAGYNPEKTAFEARGIAPYSESVVRYHSSFCDGRERDLKDVFEGLHKTLMTQELTRFRELIEAAKVVYAEDEVEVKEALTAGGVGRIVELASDQSPDRQAKRSRWNAVTGDLDLFIAQRRSLAQLANRMGREGAYFSHRVRNELGLEPIVAGISVFK